MACVYQRSDFPVSRDDVGVFLWVSCLSATRRRALLCELFRGQNVQPVHPIPDLGRVLYRSDTHRDWHLRNDKQAIEPSLTAKRATQIKDTPELDPVTKKRPPQTGAAFSKSNKTQLIC